MKIATNFTSRVAVLAVIIACWLALEGTSLADPVDECCKEVPQCATKHADVADWRQLGLRIIARIPDTAPEKATVTKKIQNGADAAEALKLACDTKALVASRMSDGAAEPAEIGTAKDKICADRCSASGVFCIDVLTGQALCPGGEPPAQMDVGDTLRVRFMGSSDEDKSYQYQMSVAKKMPKDRLFPAERTSRGPAPALTYSEVRVEQAILMPGDAASLALTLTRAKSIEGPYTALGPTYNVIVDQGHYYLEVGLLVPVVINGSRTATLTAIPGTIDKRLTVSGDTAVSPALALTVYPFGRRNGCISTFGPTCKFRWKDLLGAQVAVDIDLKNAFSRFYVGLALAPFSGISVSGGLAMVKSDYLPSGYTENMLLPGTAMFTPDRKYMPTGFVGISITNEILTSIKQAADAIRANKAQ